MPSQYQPKSNTYWFIGGVRGGKKHVVNRRTRYAKLNAFIISKTGHDMIVSQRYVFDSASKRLKPRIRNGQIVDSVCYFYYRWLGIAKREADREVFNIMETNK